jgi:hypothetical protein
MSRHKFLCKNCRKEISVASEAIGQRANCVLCGTGQTVPTREADAAYRESLSRSLAAQAEERRRQADAEKIRKAEEKRQKEEERKKQQEEEERQRAADMGKREEERGQEEAARKANDQGSTASNEKHPKVDASQGSVNPSQPEIRPRASYGIATHISGPTIALISIGVILVFIGCIVALVGMFDIKHVDEPGPSHDITGWTVENNGLLNAIHIEVCSLPFFLVGGVLIISGCLTTSMVSPRTHVYCPDCMELIRKEARVCGHCGCRLVPQMPAQNTSESPLRRT